MQGLRLMERWFNISLDLRVVTVSIVILIVLTRSTLKRIILGNEKGIPEPPGLPLIGHLHLFAGKLPHEIMMKLAGQYGPLMSIRMGVRRMLVVSSAKLAKEVLKTQDAVWSSRPPSFVGEIFFNNYSAVILTPANAVWRDLKKIYTSELLSAAHVENQEDQRHESVMRMVNSLLASEQDNLQVDIFHALADMNFYQLTKLVFGRKASVEDACTSTGEKKTLPQLLRELLSLQLISLGELFPYLRWLDIDGAETKITKLYREFDNFLDTQVEKRRKQLLEANDDVDNSRDFLQGLLSLLDRNDGSRWNMNHVKAALADVIGGGVDSSSFVASAAVAEIMKHPEVKEKLVTELNDVVGRERLVEESDLANLKYLKTVIKETLRLHPPGVFLAPHMSTAPSVLAGYHIPENTTLLVNAYAIHRDPELWEDPLAFKPERFLDSSIDFKGQHFQLLPFGSGRRICAGLNMASVFLEIALAQIFHTLDIQLPPGMKPEDVDLTENPGIVCTFASPVKVVVKPRLSEKLYRK